MIFIYDVHRQLTILLEFAIFINAYENIIVDLKNDLAKYTKEKDTNDERRREKLLDIIITEVLFPAMTGTDLPTETKESILKTMIIIQNMKTADEIYDFYSGALQSSKGHKVYKSLKGQNLTTFEDIRDKINRIMRNTTYKFLDFFLLDTFQGQTVILLSLWMPSPLNRLLRPVGGIFRIFHIVLAFRLFAGRLQ